MKLLFLGASNTDCRHCFSDDNLGYGYVKYTAQKLFDAFPEKFSKNSITNGGTDGFTFPRIYQKWQRLYQNMPYDIVVILGGINEVGVIQNTGLYGNAAREYLSDSAAALMQLLSSILNSGTKHVLVCEPFLFSWPDYLLNWMENLHHVRQMICQTANQYPEDFVYYVPTQHLFQESAVFPNNSVPEGSSFSACAPAVTTDGIHLSDTGHAILGELLFQKICAIIGGEKETDHDS